MPDPKPKQEHPLANILINVLIPVMVLSYLSKDPEIQAKLGKEVKPWHLGPLWAMIIALIPPLAYGAWHFVKTKHGNVFSALGFVSVLLTGGLTLYLWNADGSVKPNAGLLFGIKEASIPLVLAFAILSSHKSASPLIRVFLYNDSIFDIARIERRVAERGAEAAYARLMLEATPLLRRLLRPQRRDEPRAGAVVLPQLRRHRGRGVGELQRHRRQAHRLEFRGDRPAGAGHAFPDPHPPAERPARADRAGRQGADAAALKRERPAERGPWRREKIDRPETQSTKLSMRWASSMSASVTPPASWVVSFSVTLV